MNVVHAKYNEAILPEYRGNPLVEALPQYFTNEDLAGLLSDYPDVDDSERQLSAFERREYLHRLNFFRQALPQYLECFRYIESAVKLGYSSKDPKLPSTVNYLHYPIGKRPDIEPRGGFFKPKGVGITLIGESGVGKTSMLEQVLSLFPDVIVHDPEVVGELAMRQVVWVKVDCPHDSSVRQLCHRIIMAIDEKIGNESTTPEKTIALLLEQIEARIKSSFLGVLVIDEMQNLKPRKAGGEDNVLKFIHNLVNNLGVPVLFCGNPPFDEILSKSLKAARRAESGGYMEMELLQEGPIWDLFIDELWDLQWTNPYTPLTATLSKSLHYLSAGNIDLAVRIFKTAQMQVIGSKDEFITQAVLELAASIASRASAPSIEILRNTQMLKRKSAPKVVSGSDGMNKQDPKNKSAPSKVIAGDLSRPQHKEFYDQIYHALHASSLQELIDDPDFFRRLSGSDDIRAELEKYDILCDPLVSFG